MPDPTPSSYEALRLSNIARNNNMLATLGLATSTLATTSPAQTPHKPRQKRAIGVFDERASAHPADGTRRVSMRLQHLQNGNPSTSTTSENGLFSDQLLSAKSRPARARTMPGDRKYGTVATAGDGFLDSYSSHISHMLGEVGVDCAEDCANRWDSTKMHPHLTLSCTRRTVVTTGCAGYGGVLACTNISVVVEINKQKTKIAMPAAKTVSGKKSGSGSVAVSPTATSNTTTSNNNSSKRWRVEVLCEGVGGFAVGVANRRTAYPFKSLGNRTDAWVLHSSGLLLHNRAQSPLYLAGAGEACEFGQGDVLSVELCVAGELRFWVNGEEARGGPGGVAAVACLPAGEYVLCCQPYMGGGARLLPLS